MKYSGDKNVINVYVFKRPQSLKERKNNMCVNCAVRGPVLPGLAAGLWLLPWLWVLPCSALGRGMRPVSCTTFHTSKYETGKNVAFCTYLFNPRGLRIIVLFEQLADPTKKSVAFASSWKKCFWAGSFSLSYESGSFYHQAKIVRKNLIPTVLWLLYDFYLRKIMKMFHQKVISRKT